MTCRRLFLLNTPIVVVGFAIMVAYLLWPRTPPAPPTAINQENAAKIKIGMKQSEIDGILGGPPRDESTGPIMADWAAVEARGEAPGPPEAAESYAIDFRKEKYYQWVWRQAWVSNHLIVSVEFIYTGWEEPSVECRVRSFDTLPVCRVNADSLDKLHR